jgi:hypothetical protein
MSSLTLPALGWGKTPEPPYYVAMNTIRRIRTILLYSLLIGCWHTHSSAEQANAGASASPAPSELRDGQHDFDFNIGVWKTHIRRLLHPLTGSKDWVDLDGTVSVRKIWDGRAQLEEIEANGQTGRFEGVTLFLYNPPGHQWRQYFANSSVGVLVQPVIGEFKNGRGEFFDQESFNDRAIFVRMIWSDITADSHRLEQSFSDDGGQTWETNFIATMTREREAPKSLTADSPQALDSHEGQHDFDFNFGAWKTHITRLEHPLSGSHTWVQYDGISNVSKIWNGRASLFELEATGPAGHVEGVGLRLYNPKSHQWSLNWANSGDGVIGTPTVGRFSHGQGQFYDQEEFQGKVILDRNGFSDIKPDSSHFEQAFSDDGGKDWETNWIMTFTR